MVPVGDGLDYEVRESAESIIPLVEGAQGQLAIVPVPTTDALAPEPPAAVAGPEPDPGPVAAPAAEAPEPQPEPQPQFVADSGADATVSEEAAAAGVAAFAAYAESVAPKEPEDRKKAKRERKAKAKPAPAGTPATEGERKLPRRRTARKATLDLSAEQIDRIRKMKPRSVNKIINTLKSAQFGVDDAEAVVRALVEHGIISVDAETEHITWIPQEGETA